MMREYHTEKDKQALANWEKWMNERKEVCSRIGKAIGTEPTCLLMNRERKWDIDRQRDVIYDAQLVKEYECRCGKTGCPLFWKTTEPRLPGSKNLPAEVFFSPLKLTHENKKLSHLIEDGYVGVPRLIREEKGILGQECFENTLKKWQDNPYYKKKVMELEKEIEEVEYAPNIDDLIVIGKTLVQEEVVRCDSTLPRIVVEEYKILHKKESTKMPILSVGKMLVKGDQRKGINWTIEFTGGYISQHFCKYVKFKNRGQIAISYHWKKKNTYKNLKLPLRITKDMMTRFFFNKSEGIVLPGQTFYQYFWFHSRTPGIFKEAWTLETKPALPPIVFYLEGIVSMSSNKEVHENNEINNYLKKLVTETEAREAAEMALHRVPYSYAQPTSHADKFSEEAIFLHNNPNLYYHMDAIEKLKKLHVTYLNEEWNFSMDDFCNKLLEKLQNEHQSVKDKAFKCYSKQLRKLQKKPAMMDMLESDWDIFKYHMTYLLLCAAIAEMEKCLNYESWGLKPPNAPPGPEEEYEGLFDEKEKDQDEPTSDELINDDPINDEPKGEKESDTEEDEAKLAIIEKEMIKVFGDDALSKTDTTRLNLGIGLRFPKDDTSKEEREIDNMEEEVESEEDAGEEHVQEEEKHRHFLEEVEEEELYEEEMSEEEISLSTLLSEEKVEGEEEKELADLLDNDGTDEDIEEEDEEEEEESDDDDDDDEDYNDNELKIEEEEDEISIEQEVEMVEQITEKVKQILASPPKNEQLKSVKKVGGDAHTKKGISSKLHNKQLGKEEQKQGVKDEESTSKTTSESETEDEDDLTKDLRPREDPPLWVRKHFLMFAKIQWRQILEDAIDDIAALLESINFYKGAEPHTNIKFTGRVHYPC